VDFEVSRRCFTPVPKVDSVVISLRQLENPYGADVLQRTEILTRMAFNQRRKKLRNSLSSLIQDMDHHQLPVDLDRRAETLSPEEFVALANSVFSQGQTGCDQSSPSP
jgi:16S rRNA (adenine1518-N6/adenine1519-N6)-dimethyltransferase